MAATDKQIAGVSTSRGTSLKEDAQSSHPRPTPTDAVAPSCQPEDENTQVRLGEFREFQVAGKWYLFVTAVGGIFGVDELGREVLARLAQASASVSDALEYTARRPVTLPEIFSSLELGYTRAEIRKAVSELAAIGAIRFLHDGAQPVSSKLPPVPFPQRTLVLNVANNCNLGCTYCFEAPGGHAARGGLMDEVTARQSLDFLLQSSGANRGVTVVLFGGEPLMNLKLIRTLVEYAKEAGARVHKRVDFTMTTNATYLTPEVSEFLSENGIGVSVSIDGPKKYHDLRRTLKNGQGTYDLIEPRVRDLLRRHRTRAVAARVTLSHGHTAIQESFWHLKAMGFHEVGFAPVTSSETDDFALSNDELAEVMAEFRQLSAEYVAKAKRNEYLGFSNLSNLLSQLHAGVVKAYPCGAGLGLLAVGEKGELFPCQRFLGSAGHSLGSVFKGIDQEKQADFVQTAHLRNKPSCQACWVRHICSGGCYHEAYTRYGDLHRANEHYCEWIRTWVDVGLRAYVEIAEANSSFITQFIDHRGG